MAPCPQCGAEVAPDLLFCRNCGATVLAPPPVLPSAPTVAAEGDSRGSPSGAREGGEPAARPTAMLPPLSPPPDWIPPRLEGRAQHCRVCNTLISKAAVYCPACGGAQADPAAGAAAVEPPRWSG